MGEEDYYLELCERPVHFEKANPVNCVFFDEANKQVFAVRSGGATGVVVKGPDDRNPISFRMEDKGEVKCIKFSLENKILAVQRTSKTVDFSNFTPDSSQLEYTQECKTKNANILGFCWTSSTEIVFITDQGIEFYQVLPEKRNLKLLKSQNINVNWYMYCPESAVILLSTTVLGNVLQPFYFRAGTMSKLPKFEIELPAAPKSTKLSLSERDIAMATIEGACKKMHILKLNRTGKFALNVVDNLVVVHHQDTETSVIFDIKLRGEFDGTVTLHHPVLPARSIQPYQIPVAGPAPVTSQSPIPCKLYSSSWIVFQPDIIISASQGYLWNLQVKLQPIVNLLPDKGRLMDFLLQRRECKTVVLSVCSQMLTESDRATLPVIATVFDKLNQEYKKYLDAEQSYTLALEAGQSRSGPFLRRPARTQAVVDQSDMYTHVLSAFAEKKEMPQKFMIAVLMEYIRSLNQFQITVQHYLHELVIKTLVQHNLFYTLHQFLQYHVLSDSKPLACLLLSLESFYPPAHQLSLDMLKRLSTANDEIVEVLLSKHQVLAALRFIRGIGGHDNISARKFLDAAKQTEDHMLFYTIFRFFEQRNQRLRGNPSFTPGEHCEEHVAFFKQVFGDQALMRPTTF
ncbi:regulator of MON1-CCZ1 complex isoform X2 [Orcinus orca]|uniref:Regulator of MON1-CCZ1 complex isoform X3 n=1 Tax=Tursiops truncatus TaxID=9739 RepID=A0A2U4AYN4_TURTR|nr:regulator of MON1-CCZ1 complex isoform X3 [Tursiops truncatus]XP_030698513.1 regulator of MON1-CCZ1 complex isoform X3 [Globicephala melas]XP_033291220.1 regulator of MON1-CCZ1 complex isoform X2 [Orcinus orca]XP_059884776.1 regulator of MON1-CCZ1 complex isoform X2 [Delphinus delphis]XP_059977809.1 regulator of MON1-CCZ1 complex isoform X4 [Lagenorhynchus albirostris]